MEGLGFKIKQEAVRLGFDACGLARAEFLDIEAKYLEKWLLRKTQGKMGYMEKYFDIRTNPNLFVEGAKTVIVVLKNYYPQINDYQPNNAPKISKYAWGKDYHFVLKKRLIELLESIKKWAGNVNGRCFTDSAPVMEKVWAKKAGLGWIGKHTNLINRKLGSFFFIGGIMLDVDMKEFDSQTVDYCGICRKCIDACPTNALTEYEIDASKCISYLTIELKTNIIGFEKEDMKGWIFGCDICQDVCPWNRFSSPHSESDFHIADFIKQSTTANWLQLNGNQYKRLFKQSAISRIRLEKMLSNLESAGFIIN